MLLVTSLVGVETVDIVLPEQLVHLKLIWTLWLGKIQEGSEWFVFEKFTQHLLISFEFLFKVDVLLTHPRIFEPPVFLIQQLWKQEWRVVTQVVKLLLPSSHILHFFDVSLACSNFKVQFLVQKRCANRSILCLSLLRLFFCLLVVHAHSLNLFEQHDLFEESHFGRWILVNFTAVEIIVKSILVLLVSLASTWFHFFHWIQLHDCVHISDILLILYWLILHIEFKLLRVGSWSF